MMYKNRDSKGKSIRNKTRDSKKTSTGSNKRDSKREINEKQKTSQ